MSTLEDISDSTDWLNTPVASLGAVEAGLRCHICKDFFEAPVITACSHTFCSACIRRSLSAVNAQKKCPLCWSQFDERQLRKNTTVEDLVRAFQTARPDILKLGRHSLEGNQGAKVSKGRKRKLEDSLDSADNASPRKTRSHSKRQTVIQSSASPELEESIEDGDQREGDFQPGMFGSDANYLYAYGGLDGLAACPICQRRMPESQVFTHLDVHQIGEGNVSKGQAMLSRYFSFSRDATGLICLQNIHIAFTSTQLGPRHEAIAYHNVPPSQRHTASQEIRRAWYFICWAQTKDGS